MADDLNPKAAAAAAPAGETKSRETYDDRPFHSDNLPPEVRAPLAPFKGEPPPAPEWFKWATAQPAEQTFVVSQGARIEALSWGERGKPGLLLVHGNSAHAEWWSPLAPYLAKDYRVTSMSLAGMGNSDWRDVYSFHDFAADAEAVSQATGLYEGGEGYAWKFDPNMWEKMDRSDGNFSGVMPELKVPMIHLYGDKSRIIDRKKSGERSFLDGQVPEIEIPDSHHHVMIDQPLALVAALRTLLASWPA